MCYVPPLRKYFLAAIAAVSLLSNASADDPDVAVTPVAELQEEIVVASEAELASDHLVGVYYTSNADKVENHLLDSGLAEPEIDELVDVVAGEYARCIVTSLQKTNNYEADFVIKMLADGEALDDIGLYLDSLMVADSTGPLQVFDSEADACMQSVGASYGLNY